MIKRIESESTSRSKNRSRSRKLRQKKRRLFMEGLERRELLAANPVFVPLPDVDPELFRDMEPRNIGAAGVQAAQVLENEIAAASGINDTPQTAQFINFGTLPGQNDTVDVDGTIGIEVTPQGQVLTDLDTFAVDLRAGDILDLAVLGSGANLTVMYENGRIWWGTDLNVPFETGGPYPPASPLQDFGNAVGAQVVPEDGRYYIQIAPSTSTLNYTMGMRVYRPVLEQTPIGTQQVLFLDFDGGTYPTSDFAPPPQVPLGIVRVLGLEDSLDVLGFVNPAPGVADRIIDYVIQEVEEQLNTIAINGTNGDYDSTGTPGQYGTLVLNSRDHIDPGNHPLVTRMVIGSEVGQPITGLYGIAQGIDVGNFQPGEKVLVQLETHFAGVQGYPLAPNATLADAIAQQMAATIVHEGGHSWGIWHTDGNNSVDNLMDEGSQSLDDYAQGIGNDGIFGSADDITPGFNDDRFSIGESLFFGVERVPAALSHVLSTGTRAGTITGRAFNDLNGNGNDNRDSDPGLAGVTVFADLNNNGILDPTDPVTVTGPGGGFSLDITPGTFDIIAFTPDQFVATTDLSQPAIVSLDATAGGIEFGFNQVVSDVTGFKFADLNGDGLFDDDEPGIEGVYIYLDLDGDNRPDLAEPSDFSAADGSYSINFPGPGTYTIREIIEPGFIQTFPGADVDNEHTVFFNGIALAENYNFGNLPSRDFGDAPDTFLTLDDSGGPSHGITPGLTIGAVVDRELDGQPNLTATGDDANGRVNFDGSIEDDEDGARLLSPLGPGDSAELEVTLTNTTGSPAYLQAWMDFNLNGTFDADEQFASDLVLGTGTHVLPVFVPATASVGDTYVRLRYSLEPGLGVGGRTDTGEVEDYTFPILDAAEVANDDEFSVSRNTQANRLDVLANDFQTLDNELIVIGLDVTGTNGTVVVAADGKSVFYTPPTSFIGRDVFGYTVMDEFGRFSSAVVVVNVTFQSAVPIALDDSFEVPEGSVNRALNVLDNDVASIAGGIAITSVTPGNQGGTLSIVGGGQSIRYTPLPGFNGTEQFTYSIQDGVGSVSTATVTINVLPGSRQDDIVDFTLGIFDTINDREITDVRVGDIFNVRVFIDDLRNVTLGALEGVASAFLDLLYTDELVATTNNDNNPNFPFDISFGELFSGGGTFQQGDAQIPGLLNEIGGVQPVLNQQQHSGPVELLTVTMQAVSPGVAIFQVDPADEIQSETAILGDDTPLPVEALRLGNAELTISPATAVFASATDDSFPDGRDSDGNLIIGNAITPARLDVLANDNFGATGTIGEFGVVTAPRLGTATINENGTPGFASDDFIEYVANVNASGFDEFSYVIVSADGITSTATVTLALGNAGADDLVAMDFGLVNASGTPITAASVGDRVGVQVILEDLRSALESTYVFAGYLDMTYDSGILMPADTIAGDRFDFDVTFESDFNAAAGVGTAAQVGIIDEFGTLLVQSTAEAGAVDNPNLMATVWFNVVGAGTTRVVGGPADASPFQDTLLFGEDDPVTVDRIRYDVLEFTAGGGEGEALHNHDMPGDVNDDGDVSPIDALLVINHLGQTNLEGEEGSGRKFYDVSGDGTASSLDALLVINALTKEQLARESELVVANVSQSSTASESAGESDAVFALLNDSPAFGGAAITSDRVAAPAVVVADSASNSDDSDDDDDVLGLLADDVSGLWN